MVRTLPFAGTLMDFKESDLLAHAHIIIEAVALSTSVLEGDIEEARFRAQRVASLSRASNFPMITEAAVQVSEHLRPGDDVPVVGLAAAIDALSVCIDQARLFAPLRD